MIAFLQDLSEVDKLHCLVVLAPSQVFQADAADSLEIEERH
jgi:hypothetical protein